MSLMEAREAMAQFIIAVQSASMCPQRPPKPRDVAPVYFLRCGPYIKIGYSINPRTRLNQLRNGDPTRCPADIDRSAIELVQTEPGGRTREYQLRQQFKHLHHFGEWFTEAPELTDYINALTERKTA